MRRTAVKFFQRSLCCRAPCWRAESQRALSSLASGLQSSTNQTNQDTAGLSHMWPYAFALGAAAAWMEESRCDAAPDLNHLTDARVKVMHAWEEVQQDLHRFQASSPFPYPGHHTRRLRTPDVSWKDGRLCIRFQIREGVAGGKLLNQLATLIGSQEPDRAAPGGQVEFQAFQGRDTKVFQLKSGSTLRSEVCFPQDSQSAYVEICCQAPLGEDDMSVLRSAFLAVHGVTKLDGNRSGFSMELENLRSGVARDLASVFGHFGALAGAELDEGMVSFVAKIEEAFFPPMSMEEQIQEMRKQYGLPPSQGFPGQELGDLVDGSGDPRLPGHLQGRREIPDALKEAATSDQKSVDYGSPQANAAVKKLEKLGAIVYPPGEKGTVDWGILAGYEEQKEVIEETLLLAMTHPEVYSGVTSKTRRHGGTNRPRAVLFEGPPGCGKTTSARVLAAQASAPLVYVPIEAIASKWYGESERILGDIFKAAEQLDSCLVFLDEIDSLATSRSSEMNEATRRILGVLLRQLDGFEGKHSIVIGATNRKQDLDAALRSRFSSSIHFQLPNLTCRQQILSQYAQQLTEADLQKVAGGSEGMSGRDLRDICEQAERRTASKIVRGALPADSLPKVGDYLEALATRQKASTTMKGVNDILSRLRESRT